MKRTKQKGFGVKAETDDEPKPIKLSLDSDNPMLLSARIKGLGKILVNLIYLPNKEISLRFGMAEDCNYLPFAIDDQKGILFTKSNFSQSIFVSPSDPAIVKKMTKNKLLTPSLLEIAKQLVAISRISD